MQAKVMEDRRYDPALLGVLLELDEIKHNRRAQLEFSWSFVWLLLGIFLGGGLVMIWAG